MRIRLRLGMGDVRCRDDLGVGGGVET
jgi:hypothetical protein